MGEAELERYYAWAIISFLPPEIGGRSFMVEGDTYSPSIKVVGEREYCPVRVHGMPVGGKFGDVNKVQLELSFHGHGGDYSTLIVGAKFEVVEGPKVVGVGEIISSVYKQPSLRLKEGNQ